MDEPRLPTVFQLQTFLADTLEVRFCVPDNDDVRYAYIASVAQRFGYARLNRPDKGVVLRYLLATCGYSRTQCTRLLARVLDGQSLHKRYRTPAHAFAQRFHSGGHLPYDPVRDFAPVGLYGKFSFFCPSLIHRSCRRILSSL